MLPANIAVVLLAVALSTACWATLGHFTAAAANGPARATAADREPVRFEQAQADGNLLQVLEAWRDRLAAGLAQAYTLLADGYAKAPALVIALSALLVLPAVALVSFMVQSAGRRRAQRAASRVAELKAGIADLAGEAPASGPAPLWPHQAWLSIEDGGAATLPLAGQLIRIGRHEDNDIRLPDASVHRYHAVIEHTPEEAFVIVDLSGNEGNGLRINGERLARAQLADGDVIELGRTRLKFESVPV